MPRAVVLGCSHAAGSEMETDPDRPEDIAPEHFGPAHSYPVQLAQLLGYSAENYSLGGGSNDAVFRIFTDLADQLTEQDLIIACWTGSDRTEVWDPIESTWHSLSAGNSNFNRRVVDPVALAGRCIPEPVAMAQDLAEYQAAWVRYSVDGQANRLNKIKNIIALNAMARATGIPVLNIDSFAPIRDFEWPGFVTWATRVPFWDWAVKNSYPQAQYGHFFLAAHTEFARLVFDQIQTTRDGLR